MNTQADTGFMLPLNREYLGLPETQREIFSPRNFAENISLATS